jgi:hypothetical protein
MCIGAVAGPLGYRFDPASAPAAKVAAIGEDEPA